MIDVKRHHSPAGIAPGIGPGTGPCIGPCRSLSPPPRASGLPPRASGLAVWAAPVLAALVLATVSACSGDDSALRSSHRLRHGPALGESPESTGEIDDLALGSTDDSVPFNRARRHLDMSEGVAARCRLWRPVIETAAAEHGVDPALMAAIAWAESRFQPDARSRVGARGLMQLMPKTATAQGCSDPRDPPCAAAAAARLMVVLLERFDGREVYALCAYNAGAGRVRRAWKAGVLPANFGYAEVVLHARSRLLRNGCVADKPRR